MFEKLKSLVIKPFSDSHPIVLFSYFFLVIVLAIMQQNYYLICLSASCSIILDYYFNPDSFVKDLKYSVILVLVVGLINPLFVSEGYNVLYQNDYIIITSQALIYGFIFGILLASMLLWFKILRLMLKDSHIVYLFGSIMPTIGLVISMSLNIIKKLKMQYQKIKEANRHIPCNNKMIYYRNVVIILVTYAFESSLDMINSMNGRGYGTNKRTSFHLYSFRFDDLIKLVSIVFLTIISFVGYFNRYQSFYYYPIIQVFKFSYIDLLFILSYVALMLLPLYLGGKKNV